jgi:diguanylate cyclase (GGDEF)-like protein
LHEKRERIQKIQEALSHHISEVIKQNEKFGVLLEVEDETLRQTDKIDEVEGLKHALLTEVGRLRDGHQTLAKKLDTAAKYLQIIGTEGQHLNEELTRVHILSLTDELTDLPNRRAFLRRLEDEVARVQRYGYPLSLALIDMDGFKGINDRYGHAAGDEVLRTFAGSMLSIFRHHDMVARYGGEEFAVLLPNTDRNGAMRALEKVTKRTAESSFHSEGRTMPMPTFSAGISLYKPGETPGSLIERADKALYQAKRLGRNRIEVAQLDGAEATAR